MIEWITVISVILFGLLLIVAEIVFIPGTTFVGVLGFIIMLFGIAFSFHYFGNQTGWATIGGSAIVTGAVLYFSFKANVWGRFAHRVSNPGKLNEGELAGLVKGQEGLALSALRPIGKAEMGGKTYEVKTMGSYVNSGTRIRIIQISSNQIIVEPII